jgi:leucyl-tRNA synthetase
LLRSSREDGIPRKLELMSMKRYFPSEIEQKWQKVWKDTKLYRFDESAKTPKYYNLVELPYPSGDLHMGHWFAFAPADAHARYKRMNGLNVFFPNGFDAFGLPAENAAIKRGIHPKDWTLKNIQTMEKQFATMGTMIDWSHEVVTCLPEYYRWNQWIFLKMFEKSVAYRGKALSNWCPTDQTVLANEHIENGKCWRCGTEVIQKEVEQWFLAITKYADDLIWPENPEVDWPKQVREGQNNWIGRKEGINIDYKIENSKEKLTVFTTRPDTNFGATFIALAPEHPLVNKIAKPEKVKEVTEYVEQAKKKTELERMEQVKEKTGVFTGSYAINDLTGYKMPIWVSDFVLVSFGTGALVGVPGHDTRDFEFSTKFGLEVKRVVVGRDGDKSPITKIEQVQEQEGTMVNSEFLDGLDIHEATEKIMNYLEEKGWGKKVTTYHLRDWSVSRQRYWGTPVPIIHCEKCGLVPVPYKELPVKLPYNVDYTPKGKPPLATDEEWLNTKCPKCGGKAKRDAETLDTFFDSAWYYYRYVSPKFNNGPFDEAKVAKLMPINVYFGGAEHTLGHTLYARFFTKFFKDLGLVQFGEFAKKRVQHGVILGPDGNRMSKSKGNVVNPDDVVKEYGADAVRLYLCFMMPYEATAPWSTSAISGIYRFLKRIWELQEKVSKVELSQSDLVQMHKTLKKVGDDLNNFQFNTAVAQLMTWLNYLSAKEKVGKEEYATLLKLLAPFAPFITEELWQSKGLSDNSVHLENWPSYQAKYLIEEMVSVVVQVNGKLRDTVTIQNTKIKLQNEVEKAAKHSPKVSKYLENQTIKKVIYIEGKLINFVIG